MPGPNPGNSACEPWRSVLLVMDMPFEVPLPFGATIKLMDLGSILSRLAGSKDCFRLLPLDPGLGLATRNEGREGDVGVSAGVSAGDCSCSDPSSSSAV